MRKKRFSSYDKCFSQEIDFSINGRSDKLYSSINHNQIILQIVICNIKREKCTLNVI